jgi:pantoate--beta-alanine ligase
MCRDLLLSHPTPENLHVVPTTRDQETGLALSSRNAYLSPDEYAFAPTVYKALKAAENRWDEGGTKQECVRAATDLVLSTAKEAQERGVHIKLDYIAVNDSDTFDVLGEDVHKDWNGARGNPVIVSGAVWVGKTRLIDNVLLSEDKKILIKY